MGDRSSTIPGLARRAFLQLSVAGTGAFGVRELFAAEPLTEVEAALRQPAPAPAGPAVGQTFGVPYAGDRLNRIAFPLGGLGAGMVCLEGTGAFSHVSVRHQPDVFNSPLMFAALGVKGQPELARVLEAPVPEWKLFGGAGHGQWRRRHVVWPAAPRRRHVPRALPVRDGGAARSASAARSHADRLEPVRAERRRRVQPAGRRPRVPNRQSRPHPPRRRVLVPRPQLHGRPRRPQAVRGARRRLRAVGRAGQGIAVGRRQLRRHRRRAGHDGRSRLVPRRLVGSADADVEGGDRRGARRAAARHRRPAGAGRIAVRAGDARARRRRAPSA